MRMNVTPRPRHRQTIHPPTGPVGTETDAHQGRTYVGAYNTDVLFFLTFRILIFRDVVVHFQ
jgi:hypothetical protein